MTAAVKSYVAALGLRKTIGVLVAVLLIAVAASGWASTWASSQSPSGAAHHSLEPVW